MIHLSQSSFVHPDTSSTPSPVLSEPVTALAAHDEIDSKRYQYWSGASGKKYICTIFGPEACPNVKTAVFIAVHRSHDGGLTPISVGHFSSTFLSGGKHAHQFGEAVLLGANEIHLHLLADDIYQAEQASKDLQSALFPIDTPL